MSRADRIESATGGKGMATERVIDVLAVLDDAAMSTWLESTQTDLQQARAAVAELVKAAEIAESRLLTLDNMQLRELPPNEDVRERLNAALDSFRGVSR